MGSVHARQYRKRDDVDLWFFDRNQERSGRFQSAFDIKRTETYDDLIGMADVVDICLPTPSHVDFGLKAIAAGRAVLMEKPMALTLAGAEQLAKAAANAQTKFMPAQVVRYFPEYRLAHDLVKRGDIGLPSAARLRRGGSAPNGSDGWFLDFSKSGGVLLDLCIHDFDWLAWTLGPVESLYSRSVGLTQGKRSDYALTTLSFSNGCVAHVEGTWMDPSGFRTSFDIAGSGGLIQHDSRTNAALRTSVLPKASEGAPLPAYEGGQFSTEDPYYQEIDGFLKAIQTGSEPPVSAKDGLIAVSISEAAMESATTGKAIQPARHF
jgi:predicted dehydrogenase